MDDIFRLELPTPFPVGPANAWWLDGPEPVLIDVGVHTPKSLTVLEAQLAARGRRLEQVRRILLTHDHVDHAGAVAEIARRSGARVFLHQRGRPGAAMDGATLTALGGFMARCGVPAALVSLARKTYRHGTRMAVPTPDEGIVERLSGGEMLDSPLGPLEVLATPGHSPDHLCYFARRGGMLFCGDTLLADITPNPILHLDPAAGFRRSPSLLQYLASLDVLGGLPVRLAHPGHGPDIPDAAGLIAANRTFIDRRRRDFIAAAAAGAATPYALARAVFGEQDVVGQFLALSETVAYLDLLERDGDLLIDWEADPIRVGPGQE